MILNRLQVKNYRILNNIDITFNKGINLIAGNNHQGKSHIHEILQILLYNNKKNLSEKIQYGKKYFQATLDFTLLGKEYTISIRQDSKDVDRELIINGKQYSTSPKEIYDYLDSIRDKELYFRAMFSIQNDIDIIKQKPAERRNMYKKIYNIDFSKNCKDTDLEIKDIKDSIIEIDKEIHLLENKEYHIKSLIDLPFSKEEKELKESNIIELEKQVDTYNTLYNELNNLNDKYNSINLEIEKLKKNKKTYTDKIEDFKNSLSKLDEMKITNRDSLQKDIDNKESLLSTYDIKSIQDNIDNIELKPLTRVNKTKYNDLLSEITTIKNRISNNEKEILDIKENPYCPHCHQKLPDVDVTLNELQDKVFNDTKELEIKESEFNTLKDSIDINDKNTEYNNEQKELKNKLSLELQNTNNKIESVNKDIQGLKDKLLNLDKEFDDRKNIYQKSITDYTDMLNSIEDTLVTSNSNLEFTKVKKTDLENQLKDVSIQDIKSEINTLQKDISSYSSIEMSNKLIQEDNERLEDIKKQDIEKLKDFKDSKKDKTDKINTLEQVKDIMIKKFPNYVITKMIKKIEDKMNTFIEQLHSEGFKVKFEEKRNAIHIVYTNEKGGVLGDVKEASGMESQLFSLAHKIALNDLVQAETLLLDEAESNFSESNALDLYKVMLKQDRQYIITTHFTSVKEKLVKEFEGNYLEIEQGDINE